MSIPKDTSMGSRPQKISPCISLSPECTWPRARPRENLAVGQGRLGWCRTGARGADMGDRAKEREASPATAPQNAQPQRPGTPGATSRADTVYGGQARAPGAPPGADVAIEAIRAELLASFPWLARLSNRDEIISLYAR